MKLRDKPKTWLGKNKSLLKFWRDFILGFGGVYLLSFIIGAFVSVLSIMFFVFAKEITSHGLWMEDFDIATWRTLFAWAFGLAVGSSWLTFGTISGLAP
jgi:hypothetical protein